MVDTAVRLVTHNCTRGVIDRLYHCRHSAGDRQCACGREMMKQDDSCLYHAAKSAVAALGCRLTFLAIFSLPRIQLSASTSVSAPVESNSNVSFYYYIDEEVPGGSVSADLSVNRSRSSN